MTRDEELMDDSLRHTDPASAVLANLAARFTGHPGFMLTPGGIEILHANWPAYPRAHGVEALLDTLGEFPAATNFFSIDNIDRCTLFVVGRKPEREPFGKNYMHVAFWDEDLLAAARSGYLEQIDDDNGFLRFRDSQFRVTLAGTRAILVRELLAGLPEALLERASRHVEGHRYDTAVREAALLLELRLRNAVGSQAYGQRLVDECFGPRGRLAPGDLPNTHRLTLHGIFKGFFAYVRNEYAHNVPVEDLVTTCRHLRRCGRLYRVVELLEAQLQKGPPNAESQ
jgi:hypothetical protein